MTQASRWQLRGGTRWPIGNAFLSCVPNARRSMVRDEGEKIGLDGKVVLERTKGEGETEGRGRNMAGLEEEWKEKKEVRREKRR